MSVWDDLIEARPEWVTLILEDGERYEMDASYSSAIPYLPIVRGTAINVSCESWNGLIQKNDGDELILYTHFVHEGDKRLEGTRVPVEVDWSDWTARSGKARV